ncbi:MAG: polymer-forming cytoskeletal protein [Pseudobdellovibrionaceae bacterium]
MADQNLATSNNVTAILDQGTSFEGKLSFEGTAQINGEFKGEIFTRDTIIVSEGAHVVAEIEADTIVINGKVEGNIFAKKRVIMHPPAVFRGTVTSPSLRIDEGVIFEGLSQSAKT